jgi:hypothetical protein
MALFILNAVDDNGRPYDESIFEPDYFEGREYGSDAAAEAAAVEAFEAAVSMGPWPAWQLLRVGVAYEAAAPAVGEAPAVG